MEAGVVVDLDGRPLYWHLPEGRSTNRLPDSQELWRVLWENRHRISGFAHSHPGLGLPRPSCEDLSTFAVIELALGKRLTWWIASEDTLVVVQWKGPGERSYQARLALTEPAWLSPLRVASEAQGAES